VMPPVEGTMVTDIVAAQPRTLQNIILDQLLAQGADPTLGELDIKSVYDFDGVDTAKPNIPTVADPTKTPAANRAARFIRLEKAVSLPDRTIVDLAGAAFGASGFMKEIMGYAPVQPDGSVRIQVPANVAFQVSVLDANGRRISPVHNAWLQVKGGEVLVCNGCHIPAAAQNLQPGQIAKSHGRKGLFNPAYTGLAAGGTFPGTNPALVAMAGETMAETLGRMSCANDTPRCIQKAPSMNVSATEIWSNPPATTANISLRYQDLVPGEKIPVVATGCLATWISSCRTVINYPQHIQTIWDATRQTTDPTTGAVLTDHTCSQAGCHNIVNAANAPMVPAGQLNLTSTASDVEPLQPVSYQHLLFTHNEQAIIGGALQDAPGPPDANGNPTTIPVGPYMNAGSANGTQSSAFLGRFGPGARTPAGGVDHSTFLNTAELRLISEWLDIGAQFFNNPFDPAVPVN